MDLLSMDDDNITSSSPPGSAGGNRHRTASGSSGSAAGLSGDVLAEVRSLFICCVLCLCAFLLSHLSGAQDYLN